MKLTKEMMKRYNQRDCSSGKIHESADRRISVASGDGTSQLGLVAPSGIFYVPIEDSDAVVIQTDSGKVCVGVRLPDKGANLLPGELMLYSQGGANIVLKNDGKVYINGKEF